MRSPPKFAADAMLGSLARKLRIFGFDTAYFKEGDDSDLELLARRERRTVLTSDKGLFDHAEAAGLRAVLVTGATDRARLLSVFSQTGLSPGGAGESRCAVCNGELRKITKGEASAEGAPPKVLARHRLFYRCTSCSRLYWRGRHWARLRRLASSIRRL
ncbi:MAG TPA: Mut7-C RNAse domain-containing protein [Nitrososphaerales archaeon]|nr:Mut7-C RNAse domain-containing protein [Nitrososphaerales archaeon]